MSLKSLPLPHPGTGREEACGKSGFDANHGTQRWLSECSSWDRWSMMPPAAGDWRGTFLRSPYKLAPVLAGYNFPLFVDRATLARGVVIASFLLVLSASVSDINPPLVPCAWQAFKCCCFVIKPRMREIYMQPLLNGVRISSSATSLVSTQLSAWSLSLTTHAGTNVCCSVPSPSTLSLHSALTFSFLQTLAGIGGLGHVKTITVLWFIGGYVCRTLNLVGIERDKPNALLLSWSQSPPPPPYIAWGMKWGVGFMAGSNEMVPLCKPGGAPWLAPAIQWFSEFAVWTWWVTAMVPLCCRGRHCLWEPEWSSREKLRRSYDI